jgi:hypothetical protein
MTWYLFLSWVCPWTVRRKLAVRQPAFPVAAAILLVFSTCERRLLDLAHPMVLPETLLKWNNAIQ